MNQDPDGERSFDPRTWLIPQSGAVEGERAKSADDLAPSGEGARTPGLEEGPASAMLRTLSANRRLLLVGGGLALAAVALPVVILASRKGAHGADGKSGATPAERRTMTIDSVGDLVGALTSFGVVVGDAQAVETLIGPRLVAPGALRLTIVILPNGAQARLVSLEVRREDGGGVMVAHDKTGRLTVREIAASRSAGASVVRSEMDGNNFYTSAVAAGVPDVLISPFAQAFTFDFDFQREVTKGDIFEAVFAGDADGRGAGPPSLLFVALETEAKSRKLYAFTPKGGKAGWFDTDGRSTIRSLMRTPVEGARVSSPFGMREHPVLGFMKMHNGIDFAAPVGTPIYAAGDGVVEFSGPKGPNGNFVKIRHPDGRETLYLHMNRIEPAVTTGAAIRQGQQIGEVGATGVDSNGRSTVTGPHLHYEVHVAGVPVDPSALPVDSGQTLAGDDLKAFAAERDRIDLLRRQQTS